MLWEVMDKGKNVQKRIIVTVLKIKNSHQYLKVMSL